MDAELGREELLTLQTSERCPSSVLVLLPVLGPSTRSSGNNLRNQHCSEVGEAGLKANSFLGEMLHNLAQPCSCIAVSPKQAAQEPALLTISDTMNRSVGFR